MFGWLFGRKKSKVSVKQEVSFDGNRNTVTQTTVVVNQRNARATGDIVGGNKYSTPSRQSAPVYDPMSDLLNPLNPLSPLSPMNPVNAPSFSESETPKHETHSHSHSHDSSSSSLYDSSSSSSYDSGSSSSSDSSSY